MEKKPVQSSRQEAAGMKLEIAEAIISRISSTLRTELDKADFATVVDIHSHLGELLSSQWRRSWKDGQNWKEKTWKDGNCAKAALVSYPAESIARLERIITDLQASMGRRS